MLKRLKDLAMAIGLRDVYRKSLDLYLKLRGFELLNEPDTHAFLERFKVSKTPKNRVLLPTIRNGVSSERTVFAQKEAVSLPVYVWQYHNSNKKARLSKYGSVIVDQKVLCTDRDHYGFYRSLRTKSNRRKKYADVLIAPFSHDQDDFIYGGYYDFVFLVAAKICRIKDALPADTFAQTVISYPLFKTPYELDYLKLLGVHEENVIDSRECEVIAEKVITGNFANPFYPHAADILSLRKHIQKRIAVEKTENKRIYIRRAGRRRVLNEEELITFLKKYDFEIIEDVQRSITEQVQIYKNASFILGPHGASFSNIIWCEPGTHLFELFSPNYVPDFFLYMAKVMDMQYSAFYTGSPDKDIHSNDGLIDNITVSIPALEDCLDHLFADKRV